MLHILDGNPEHAAHPWRKMGIFWRKNIQFSTALDLIKSLKQIKNHRDCSNDRDVRTYFLVTIWYKYHAEKGVKDASQD